MTALLNLFDEDIGKTVIRATVEQIQSDLTCLMIDENNESKEAEDDDIEKMYLRLRLLTRFLGELSAAFVVSADNYVCFLDTLISACLFSQEGNSGILSAKMAAFKDYFARLVLEALLFVSGHK